MRRIGSVAGRMLWIASLAVLLSGCIKLNMDLSIATDNTASGTAILAIDKQLLALTGQPAEEIFGGDTIAPAGAQGVTTKDYEDDTFIGQEITFQDAPIDALSGSGDADALKIAREGDVFTVSGALDMTNDSGNGATDDAVAGALATADISIRITFPGPVTSSNGEIDGNTVSWSPKVGERTELQAQASAIASGSSSTPVLWIALAVVALAAAVGGVMMTRRRSPTTAVGPPEIGEAPPDTEGAQPPPTEGQT